MSGSSYRGFRAKPQDEKILRLLAEYLERSMSDTIRFAVRHTAREHGLLPDKKPPAVKAKQEAKT
jgi:hypothetical protein